MASFVEAALTYAKKGWHVIPLEPRGKHPITPRGIYDATTDEDTIRRWWKDNPEANIGIATGSISGIVVVDVNGSRGEAAWTGLSRRGIPETTTQRTGRDDGGAQYFFQAPGEPFKTREELFAGLAIQGEGGWVVVPPSIHQNGKVYAWTTKIAPATVPLWLVELILKPPQISTIQPPELTECRDDCPPPPSDDDDPESSLKSISNLIIADVVDPSIPWFNKLLLTGRQKKIKACISNALKIIHHHRQLAGLLAFNERKQAAVWIDSPPWRNIRKESPEIIDADATYLNEFLAEIAGLNFPNGTLLDAMIAEARRHQFDPVIQYLTKIRWDGFFRLDKWLVSYFGAAPSAFVYAAGAAWAISAVARAFRPGCQADYMIVLEGFKQGEKKSRGLEVLASEEFYANVTVDPSSKDCVMALHGPWIVEWGELAGLSKREAQSIKEFLTRKSDRVRPPYGRATVDLPRRVVIAGTTNEEVYLTDPTGNRRYWPIKIRECDRDALARDRDQLWAEAVARFNSGEIWYLTDEMETTARVEQEQRALRDPWEDIIAGMVVSGYMATKDFISTNEILNDLKIDYQNQHPGLSRRVAGVMRQLNWRYSHRRTNGALVRGWTRPNSQETFQEEVE